MRAMLRDLYGSIFEFVRTFGAFQLFFLKLLRHSPRMLARRPGLIVAHDNTRNSECIVRLVRRMNDALGITSIVVSHDVAEVSTVADRSYLISDGKVAASGNPDELHAANSELVRQFMHGMADGPVAFHYDAPNYAEQLLGRDAE